MRVVDIGCGDGMCTEVALNVCDASPNALVDIVGFDWSSAALKQARARGVPVAALRPMKAVYPWQCRVLTL